MPSAGGTLSRQDYSIRHETVMAISPRFALSPPDDKEPSKTSCDCVYSFDLHGNLIEMNAAFAAITGYDRDNAARLNLSQLLDQESWERSREQVLASLGGSGTQKLDLTAIGKDGRRIRMKVVRGRWRFRMPGSPSKAFPNALPACQERRKQTRPQNPSG